MMNDKKIINSFYLQDELNPDIWDEPSEGDYKLKPEIRKRLLKVAQLFIDYLDYVIFLYTILIFIGSLAGYNWSVVFSILIFIILYDYKRNLGGDVELHKELI